jgi:hypothetical protein
VLCCVVLHCAVMKLKKSAIKHLKQKAKSSSRSTGDGTAPKQSRPKSRQGNSRQAATSMRRSEQLSHEDTTADSGFIKLKSPTNKGSVGKRYLSLRIVLHSSHMQYIRPPSNFTSAGIQMNLKISRNPTLNSLSS